ncbi:MAG: tRNA (guanosine(37)-N1)-methyltransferase TrmD [Actinobacteria bacterium]|nr:tRNA (guanosine(37)-N1)-methyltransferase TrmD [Actinomycetota bacterium]
MKFTVITIFPEYFAPLSLSLIGKAIEKEALEFETIDLRKFAPGNRRSVDDTPYGGGAGMVMSPEPWGDAIDEVLSKNEGVLDLVFPTPAGSVFNQRTAESLSTSNHLVFACGRYEGIDARVVDFYRAHLRIRLHEISIGDYVINGGEGAALVTIEAVARLIPGVIGNPDSLLEESHNEIGEVEYPVYTKPAIWRGLAVPDVLLSGNHGAIQNWRRDAARKRKGAQNGRE